MNDATSLEIELMSDPCNLAGVRGQIREWAVDHGWSEHQIGEIVLALDEALSNVIRHGYGGQTGCRIVISVSEIQDPHLGQGAEIRVRDFGKQVDPTQICGRDLADVRPGGLGVHLIRSMTDSVEYHRAQGGGMLLVMRKYKTCSAREVNARQ